MSRTGIGEDSATVNTTAEVSSVESSTTMISAVRP